MRRILIFCLLAICTSSLCASDILTYEQNKIHLELNNNTKCFRFYLTDTDEKSIINGHISPITVTELSKGHYSIYKNKILLIDNKLKRRYTFLKIDLYTIKSTKSTLLVKNSDVLKIKYIDSDGNILHRYMSWKNNMKHGIWLYVFENGTSKVNYVNDIKIDSIFQTREEIYQEYIKKQHLIK